MPDLTPMATAWTTMGRRQRSPVIVLLIAVLLTMTALVGHEQAYAAPTVTGVVLNPEEPLLGVPFRVTAAAASLLAPGFDVYVTIDPTCSIANAVGPVRTLDANRQCVMEISEAQLVAAGMTQIDPANSVVVQLTLCSSSVSAGALPTFTLRRITVSPQFVPLDVATTLRFSNATPPQTVVAFFVDAVCTRRYSGIDAVSLTNSLTMDVVVSWTMSIGSLFVCARVPAVTGVTTEYFNVGRFLTSTMSSYSPQNVLRYTTVTFTIDSPSSYVAFTISASPTCETIDQPPTVATTSYMVTMQILVPRGATYTLCAGISDGNRIVYAPTAGQLRVREYGFQPHTLYATRATAMRATMDATDEDGAVQFAVFQNADCETGMVSAWRLPVTQLTLPQAGVYFACARKADGSEVACAATLTVLVAPTFEFARSPAIKGLPLRVTLFRTPETAGELVVSLSQDASCSLIVASAAIGAAGTAGELVIPYNAPNSLYGCISTPNRSALETAAGEPDMGYVYPASTISATFYTLGYDPLFASRENVFRLDPTVEFSPGSRVKFVDTKSGCGDEPVDGIVRTLEAGGANFLPGVTFPGAGLLSFCVMDPAYGSGDGFMRLRDVYVNPLPNTYPEAVLAGVSTAVTLFPVPPGAHVFTIPPSRECADGVTAASAHVQASVAGSAMLVVRLEPQESVSFCAGYADSAGTVISFLVASLSSCAATHFPPIQIIQQQGQYILRGCHVSAAASMRAFLATSTACAAGLPNGAHLSTVVTAEDVDEPFTAARITPTAVGTVTLCVGNASTGEFVSAGRSLVVAAMTVAPMTPAVVNYLPAKASVESVPTPLSRFVLTDSPTSCGVQAAMPVVYGEGSMTMAADGSSVATSSTFVAPRVGSVTLCVSGSRAAWASSEGSVVAYIYAGQLNVVSFSATQQLVQAGAPNALYAAPRMPNTVLFLVAAACGNPNSAESCSAGDPEVCRDGARDRFYSTLRDNLTAPAGFYVMCQEATGELAPTGAVAASTNVVEVVAGFHTAIPAVVRRFVPFAISVTGGDLVAPTGPVTYFVVPGDVDCNEESPVREVFTSTAASPARVSLTISQIEANQDVRICMQVTASTAFTLALVPLRPYMSPAAMRVDEDVVVVSGQSTPTTRTKISSTQACADQLSTTVGTIVNGASTLRVNSCGAAAAVTIATYCESQDNGQTYVSRGAMQLIRFRDCSTGAPIGLVSVTVPPGMAVHGYGEDTAYFVNARASRSKACTPGSMLDFDQSAGYVPAFDEVSIFFVCVSPITDNSVTVSTESPTLEVLHYSASPLSIPSRVNSTFGIALPFTLRLDFRPPTQQIFFSASGMCAGSLGSLAGLGAEAVAATAALTGVSGIVFICTANTNAGGQPGQFTAIARVLAVLPPDVTDFDPVVVPTAPFRIGLVGRPSTYSMIPGADASYELSRFFEYRERQVYLSIDSCVSVVRGTRATTVAASTSVATIETTSELSTAVGSVAVCAGTPAGNVTVLGRIRVSNDRVFPSQFVLGSATTVFVPLSPSSQFAVSFSDGSCDAAGDIPGFWTNAAGRGLLTFRRSNGALPPQGRYTICVRATAARALENGGREPRTAMVAAETPAYEPLATVEAFNPVYFAVTGRDVFVGVPTTVNLLGGLSPGELLPGFSTEAYCDNPTTTYGSWGAIGDQHIEVIAVQPYSRLYLCTIAPVNGTRIALPAARGLTFAPRPNMGIPNSVPTCANIQLPTCAAGSVAQSSTAFIGIMAGRCCDVGAQNELLARSTPRGSDGGCSLSIPSAAAERYAPQVDFSVCLFDSRDSSYCASVGTITVAETQCDVVNGTRNPKSLQGGALAAVIIASILFGVCLLTLAIALLYCCYCGKGSGRGFGSHVLRLKSLSDEEEAAAVVSAVAAYNLRHESLGGRSRLGSAPNSDAADDGRAISLSTDDLASRINLLCTVEEQERDQNALCEARMRYNLKVLLAGLTEDIHLDTKKEGVWNGETDSDDASFFRAIGDLTDLITANEKGALRAASSCSCSSASEASGGEHSNQFGVAFPSEQLAGDELGDSALAAFHDGLPFLIQNEDARRAQLHRIEAMEMKAIAEMELREYKQAVGKLPQTPTLSGHTHHAAVGGCASVHVGGSGYDHLGGAVAMLPPYASAFATHPGCYDDVAAANQLQSEASATPMPHQSTHGLDGSAEAGALGRVSSGIPRRGGGEVKRIPEALVEPSQLLPSLSAPHLLRKPADDSLVATAPPPMDISACGGGSPVFRRHPRTSSPSSQHPRSSRAPGSGGERREKEDFFLHTMRDVPMLASESTFTESGSESDVGSHIEVDPHAAHVGGQRDAAMDFDEVLRRPPPLPAPRSSAEPLQPQPPLTIRHATARRDHSDPGSDSMMLLHSQQPTPLSHRSRRLEVSPLPQQPDTSVVASAAASSEYTYVTASNSNTPDRDQSEFLQELVNVTPLKQNVLPHSSDGISRVS